MKNCILTLILIIPFSLFGQNSFERFLAELDKQSYRTAKTAMVDSFVTSSKKTGIPIICGDTANFIYYGSANSVHLAGDMNGWQGDNQQFTRVSGTNLFYFSKRYELNARLDYKIVLNGNNWILDPLNPNTCAGGFGSNSEIAMPEYVQPEEIKTTANIEKGSLVDSSKPSTNTGKTYSLKIYLPNGYSANPDKSYPTIYFQDGSEYFTIGYAVNVLNNLIAAKKIEPVIAIFVIPTNRNEEYALSLRNSYQLFFVNELVPFIDQTYRTISTPNKRLVMGDSYGGNISALIAYNHPDVFGNCGLHSAAFQENNYETYYLITNGPKKNIKWFSVWGSYESLWKNLRNFRDYLNSAGYVSEHHEYPEGHSWGLWRANTDAILEYFFPFHAEEK